MAQDKRVWFVLPLLLAIVIRADYHCTEANPSTAVVFASDAAIHDCGPNAGGDSLVYYCCNGIFRFCLSGEPGCFWKNGDCPAQYDDYTCHIPSNPHCSNSNLLAYTVSNDAQYFCDQSTFHFSIISDVVDSRLTEIETEPETTSKQLRIFYDSTIFDSTLISEDDDTQKGDETDEENEAQFYALHLVAILPVLLGVYMQA